MINNPKPKLVVLLSRIPFPLEKGDKLRAFHQIKYLSKDYDIFLCAISDNKVNEMQARIALGDECCEMFFVQISIIQKIIGVLQSVFWGRPLQIGLFYNYFTQRIINQWISEVNPDAVYVQLHRMAPYVSSLDIPKVLDFQDAFSMGVFRRLKTIHPLLRPIYYLEYRLLKNYEQKLLKLFPNSTIISRVDQKWIDPQHQHQINLVLNGVDFSYYKPIVYEKDIDVLFTGNMGYMPNIDAAEFLVNEIMPLVWIQNPTTKVVLAGATPHSRVLALQSERVIVTGFVDDLRPYYQRAKIFVAPLRMGSGLQNKLLEAMAMKVPSITSGIANNSLKATHNQEIIVCETSAEYAHAIHVLLSDPTLVETISQHAFSFVSSHFDWNYQVDLLSELIQQAIKSKTQSNNSI